MNAIKSSNSFILGVRVCSIQALATQLLKENTSDSEESLKANQAKALAWVASQMLNDQPHPSVHSSSLMFEMSGSMQGPELPVEKREELASSLLDEAESLLAEFKPRKQEVPVNFFSLSQTPEQTTKAVKFAQELVGKTYTGTRYIFLFTDGETA